MPHHLVSQAQRGDHDAFSALITERIPRLYGIAGLITGRRDLAEDAVQEALINAWRDLPRLREADRLDAWLHWLLVQCLSRPGTASPAPASAFVFSNAREAHCARSS